jgi:hypothetical protein
MREVTGSVAAALPKAAAVVDARHEPARDRLGAVMAAYCRVRRRSAQILPKRSDGALPPPSIAVPMQRLDHTTRFDRLTPEFAP